MIFVEVCVGSSCHLKGAPRIVEMLQEKIAQEKLEEEIILTGSFCTGKCNRVGVTLTVGDEIYTGVTPEGLGEFWKNVILPAVKKAKGDGEDV
ncbi:MAG: (2Fe-2S) ferredoxin domain-containing protein [Clostridia bacterium]|nr:(2Fe-2S) ferredoxin domain-containing protein [Clostridia bacterium]